MNNWSYKKLEDICSISSSKRIFYDEYVDKGIPFYRSKEIIEKIDTVSKIFENLIQQKFLQKK